MDHDAAPVARILVVDDDPGILGFVSLLLDDEGYGVATASDRAEALRRVEGTRPDLVLLDLAMPVMDGWQLTAALRARGDAPPIIFMTAGYEARDEAERHAVDGHLSKPFSAGDLLDLVEQILTRGP